MSMNYREHLNDRKMFFGITNMEIQYFFIRIQKVVLDTLHAHRTN